MKLPILSIACLVAVALGALKANGQTYTTHDGHQFSVSVKADKPTIMLGETTYLSFEVKNLSGTELSFGDGGDYRNNLGRPERYRVTVLREDGKAVPQPKVTLSTGGLLSYQRVPVNGNFIERLFVPRWATFEEPGTYNITVTRSLGISGNEKTVRSFEDRTPSVTAIVTTKLTVVETDHDRLGAVIDEIGLRMLNKPSDRFDREAIHLLDFIRDSRTVQYWIKAVRAYSADPNADAFNRYADSPQMLARYDLPEVWAELKNAMNSRSDRVRLDVVEAFSSSKNKQALPLLISMHDDPSPRVRLRVVQRLISEKTDASTEVLLRLLDDVEQYVWESAERALEERNRMPNVLPLRPLSAMECPVRQVQAVRTMQRMGVKDPGTGGGSNFYEGGENCETVIKELKTELAERRSAQDLLGEAWVQYLLGDAYRDARRYAQARDHYELAKPLFRKLNNTEAQIGLFFDLASVSSTMKQHDEARRYLNELLSMVQSSPIETVKLSECDVLGRIARSHLDSGDNAAGINFFLKQLDCETDSGSSVMQLNVLKALGQAYEKDGNASAARTAYEKALTLSKSFSDFELQFTASEIKEIAEAVQRLE